MLEPEKGSVSSTILGALCQRQLIPDLDSKY